MEEYLLILSGIILTIIVGYYFSQQQTINAAKQAYPEAIVMNKSSIVPCSYADSSGMKGGAVINGQCTPIHGSTSGISSLLNTTMLVC